MDAVSRTSEYSTRMEELQAMREHHSVQSEDDEQLQEYWQSAVEDIRTAAKDYIAVAKDDEDGLHLILLMPHTFDPSVLQAVESAIKGEMINAILARWCAVVKAEMVQTYATIATGEAEKLTKLLNTRRRPTRFEL